MKPPIGIIGVGNMGTALAEGWLGDRDPPRTLLLFDKIEGLAAACAEALSASAQRVGVALVPCRALVEVTDAAAVLVVAVKPQDLDRVLTELSELIEERHTLVSVAAGMELARLRGTLGSIGTLFRVMPNLAVALGEGVLALTPEPGCPPEETERVRGLLSGLGHVEVLAEDQLDVVTAVAASGPGFLALVLEGLEDGAVNCGLPRGTARRMVQHMAMGALRLMVEQFAAPAELKDRVSSPGGTTIAGLAVLEERGVRGSMLRAVEAAVLRGRGL